MLLAMLLIAGLMTVSFATGSASANNCGARVALVLDRSSSIGVDKYSGSAANSERNVNAIITGANAFVDSIIGPDSYTDVYAFASVAQRINTGGWFNVKDQDAANWQKMVLSGTKFKRGATSSSENAYWDFLSASSEGLTNWEHALQTVGSTRQDPFPTHLVIFTDGNPTTNVEHTQRAVLDGLNQSGPRYGNGSFAAVGFPTEDGDAEGIDIARAITSADFLRAIGIKIVPVGVGNVNTTNLQRLAGPGNPVYYANDYSQLTAKFREAAANVCIPDSTLGVITTDAETGAFIPAKINITASPFDGVVTTGGPGTPGFVYKTGKPSTAWGFNAVLDPASTPGYELNAVYCRSGAWTAQSPLVGVKIAGGIKSDAAGYAPGTTVRCEFSLKKKFEAKDGIELHKDVNPTTAKRGEAVTYSFAVKNTGNTKLTNITVNDPMLGGVVGTIAELEPGATSTVITKSYTIPNDATGTIHNVAVAKATPVNPDGSARPQIQDDDPADVVVELRTGQTIEKSVTPSVATVGTDVTYTIAVKNTGETILANVVVADTTLGKEVTIPGPINPGQTGTVQIKHTLTADNLKTGTFKNVACIKGTETCDDAVVTQPKVELTKTGPALARPGDKVTYSFTVKNTGNTDLTDFEITDETLSTYTQSPVVITVPGTLKPGESSTAVTYEFTIPANYAGSEFKNIAVVHSTPIDPETGEKVPGVDVTDEDDHIVALIRWEATKTANKSVTVPGDTVTYTITVKNTGAAALTNLEVSDPTISFPLNGEPVVIELLLPGESKSFTAEYTIPADYEGNSFKNIALVCLPRDGAIETDIDCQKPEVEVDIARIKIDKTASAEKAIPGDSVTYTFVVTNTGGVAIDPTEVHDDILGVIGNPGVLDPGASETFTKDYVVPLDTEDGSEIVNTATVCAPVPGAGKEVLSDTDCVTTCPTESVSTLCDQDDHTLIVETPSISVEKTADKESASEGDTVTYTFVVTNTSKVTLKDINLTDNVLGDLGTIDVLEPGDTYEKKVEYVVPSGAALQGTITNVVTACFLTPEWEDNCATDDHTLTVVAVGGEVVERPVETLPFTGSSSTWLAMIAVVILAVGTTLYIASRRRREI